jgi:hypothetical protein
MARVAFTANLERHLSCPARSVPGGMVRAVLDGVFADSRGCGMRRHVEIYIDRDRIADRSGSAIRWASRAKCLCFRRCPAAKPL